MYEVTYPEGLKLEGAREGGRQPLVLDDTCPSRARSTMVPVLRPGPSSYECRHKHGGRCPKATFPTHTCRV